MIITKSQLKLYIKADLMMNRGVFSYGIKERIVRFFFKDRIMEYLVHLRKYEYYINQKGLLKKLCREYHHTIVKDLGERLGFSISPNVFGYGLVIPHHGTIVVGGENRIGNFCVLHTSTCITAGEKRIGDGLYLASGAKIVRSGIELGDNISVAANSVVNTSCAESGVLLAGMPAKRLKESEAWYVRDGEVYHRRAQECRKLHEMIS